MGNDHSIEMLRNQLSTAQSRRSSSFTRKCLLVPGTAAGTRADLPNMYYGLRRFVDAVTSLGGVPVEVDAWGIDAVDKRQETLELPAQSAPLTLSSQAVQHPTATNTLSELVPRLLPDCPVLGRPDPRLLPLLHHARRTPGRRVVHEEGSRAPYRPPSSQQRGINGGTADVLVAVLSSGRPSIPRSEPCHATNSACRTT